MIILEKDFTGLSVSQKQFLENYYKTKSKSFIYSHKAHWKKIYTEDLLMLFLNQEFSTKEHSQMNFLEELEINGEDYYVLQSYKYVALFNVKTNEMHTYQAIVWKATGLVYWTNTNAGYGYCDSGEKRFTRWNTAELYRLYEVLDDFKYIDFSKLNSANPYILLNEKSNKQKLWTIEMLIKSGFTELASNLASTYYTIDFKIFKQYLDFFKKRGKNIYHYNEIIKLREMGFIDPEFIYINHYINSSRYTYDESMIGFLNNHPELNRKRFLKYINKRKGKSTQFNVNFLTLYFYYLQEAERLNLDLSKDKYAFPQDLIKAIEDHLLSINVYESTYIFRKIFDYWQSNLPLEEKSDMYLSKLKTDVAEEKEKIRIAKIRHIEKEKFLKFLWNYNSKLRFEIDDTYVLVAPTSSEDLLVEGKKLNHCVYSYVEKIGKRESSIYFLRKKGYEDSPFYTVEIINGSIQQCRTTNNQVNQDITNLVKDYYLKHKNKIPSWDLESVKNYA